MKSIELNIPSHKRTLKNYNKMIFPQDEKRLR